MINDYAILLKKKMNLIHQMNFKKFYLFLKLSLSNLFKIDPVTLKVKKREDGKILKPEGWKPPDFAKFVK